MGIASLLNPRSIAIVGASEKVGPGYNAFKALEYVGFTGRVDLVNPKSSELFGRRTFASLDQIPGSVDAVFVAVQAEAVLDVAKAAADSGRQRKVSRLSMSSQRSAPRTTSPSAVRTASV
jgi:acetate---CoA ligase (ADP-forming)